LEDIGSNHLNSATQETVLIDANVANVQQTAEA
jgi:hypothetical protein